ncbi:Endonuclease/Exonuclease/phosphatase family protein [Trichomonas vaginalis G3]|uniref:Endonuclease/Exonuclease/phosphatase family protein n=1 Tax=Trichomonas vaginalis (strain ATCC PRA-98 / G3) TaxID=412133 RepID=A2FU20_TRIV3|nr:phosphatidylinositol-4,5-bisphosphate 5-phosphatase protein [Trichomonas vaginalis G3]EAX91591.1 Endonuclease/Exonuclease/phosphatase family protein [Trichomonas vaginalis G3]KAI5516570.1 phosphatidylinositol-4,5-bisphosphate 5-phosphatase protein [Trichomonas vaginalis G3]|eukprot:XP_001304521.1 Endonuclease/Exonuclease/phosphatase family protein [Trichomonas vaginalis G3]
MQTLYQESTPWISTKATHLQNKRKYTIEIVLHGKSFRDSYLVIKEENQIGFCFIPICPNVEVGFMNDTLTLNFHDYSKIKCAFEFQNSTDLELIVSHFMRCSIMENSTPDEFSAENNMFLKTLAMEIVPQSSLDLGTTLLTPIPTNAIAKSTWEENCMKINTQFYLAAQEIRFSFLTWNVAGKKPKEEVLADIMRCFKVPTAVSDIIVIAFQEIDMSVKSVVTGSSNVSDRWTDVVTAAQQQFAQSQFELLANESCGSVYIALLARKNMTPKPVVSPVQIIKLGAGGIFANKSALYIPFRIGEGKFAAVACHLAAHDGAYEERNEQWRLIVRTIGDDVDYLPMQGDLNYRIALPRDEVVELANNGKIQPLLEADQLKNQQKKCPIMNSFKEAEIKFRPTYKFDKNSDVYDTSPKRRTPSYTDRVLIRCSPPRFNIGLLDELQFETDIFLNLMEKNSLVKSDIFLPPSKDQKFNYPSPPTNICYRSLRCMFSDHRPVHAAYKCVVHVVNKARKEQLQEIINCKYNELSLYCVPKVQLIPDELAYNDQKEVEITMKNTSYVWVNWSVKKMPPGVHIEPAAGRIFACQEQKIRLTFSEQALLMEPLSFDISSQRPVYFKFKSKMD